SFLSRLLASFLFGWLFRSFLRGLLLGCGPLLGCGFLLGRRSSSAAAAATAASRGSGSRRCWRRFGVGFGCVGPGDAGFLFLFFFLFKIFFERLAVGAAVAEFFFFVTSVERGIVERHCSS